jgi:ribosome-binding ATPase
VDLGLVGRANAGKTALFALVTGAEAEIAPYPFTTREPGRAMADVPDPRLEAIADVQDIPRRVPAQVQLVDIAGLAAGAGAGEGLGGAALGQLRQVDALVHVVRAFANAEVPHPEDSIDPVADAEAVDLELAVADRDQVERRLERVRKGARAGEAGASAELASLEALAAALDAGRPARLAADEAPALGARMELLTAKPVLYLANTDEGLVPPEGLAAHA